MASSLLSSLMGSKTGAFSFALGSMNAEKRVEQPAGAAFNPSSLVANVAAASAKESAKKIELYTPEYYW